MKQNHFLPSQILTGLDRYTQDHAHKIAAMVAVGAQKRNEADCAVWIAKGLPLIGAWYVGIAQLTTIAAAAHHKAPHTLVEVESEMAANIRRYLQEH